MTELKTTSTRSPWGVCSATPARRSRSPMSVTPMKPRAGASGLPSTRLRLQRFAISTVFRSALGVLGQPDLPRYVVLSGSTPEGLRGLAVAEHADLIVFGSEYRTAAGHVDPQASARRLLDGGPVALALAPAGFADQTDYSVRTIAAIGEAGDPCARETAETLASRLGATIAEHAHSDVDLVVVGSRPGTVTGRVTISAAAEYLIELSTCPVIVVPRGVTVHFDG